MARLDRAPRLREVAQLGSVLGREFAYDMISALGRDRGTDVAERSRSAGGRRAALPARPPAALALPVQACADPGCGLPIAAEAHPPAISPSRWQSCWKIGFPEVASTQPELVAHHYTEANCPAQAIAYWHKAGVAAASRSANLEAIDQFRRGLALVEALSDMRERAERELDLQMALGPALFATKSYSHPDIGRAYARAWELCRQLGDHSREFTALRGLHAPPSEPTRDGEGAAFCRGGVACGRTA